MNAVFPAISTSLPSSNPGAAMCPAIGTSSFTNSFSSHALPDAASWRWDASSPRRFRRRSPHRRPRRAYGSSCAGSSSVTSQPKYRSVLSESLAARSRAQIEARSVRRAAAARSRLPGAARRARLREARRSGWRPGEGLRKCSWFASVVYRSFVMARSGGLVERALRAQHRPAALRVDAGRRARRLAARGR